MSTFRLNRVATNYFWIIKHKGKKAHFRPGLDLLVASLIRCSAQKVIVPNVEPRFGRPIPEVISDFPPTIRKRIELVDQKGKMRDEIRSYLEPLTEEIPKEHRYFTNTAIYNFLYTLSIASKNEAEADVESPWALQYYLTNARNLTKEGGEAHARVCEIEGLYNLYDASQIPATRLVPSKTYPSIYERIDDILNDPDIMKYSQARHQLGYPEKVQSAMASLVKRGKNLLSQNREDIQAGVDLGISIIREIAKVPIPNIVIPELSPKSYSPPMIDLSIDRAKISMDLDPRSAPNFVMPDGGTRSYNPRYLAELLAKRDS